jgi:hypothetical protein
LARNYRRCPFSKIGCKECSIYRGRHCYINGPEEEALKAAARQHSEAEWTAGFNDFFDELDDSLRKAIKSYGWEEPGDQDK